MAIPGDANLDDAVDGSDFIVWNSHKFSEGGWCSGDFDLNGFVDGADFIQCNANKFTSANSTAVPEPQAAAALLAIPVLLRLRRRLSC